MGKIKTFREIQAWQAAHELVLFTYSATRSFPLEEKFGLTSQIRRAGVSIAANIVEGFRRQSLKDSINFYNKSDASLEEWKYHWLLSFDLKYINNEIHLSGIEASEKVGKLLTRWIQVQRSFLT